MKSLFGTEYDIDEVSLDQVKDVVKKAKAASNIDSETEKVLKSKTVSLSDKLAIIKDKVLKVLGKQKDNVLVIKDKETLHAYITDCIKAGRIDVDTETNNSLDPITCKLMGPCFYAPNLKQAYIPLNHRDPITKQRLPWQLTEADIREELQRVLDSKIPVIMHNGKFDLEVIYCTCNIWVKPDWDTMIAARLLNENERANLKEQYINKVDKSQEKYDIEDLFTCVQYADVAPEIFALYAATDAMMTDKLYELQYAEFIKPENDRLFNFVFKQIEMPIVEVTADMELRGVCVDTDFGAKLKAKYDAKLQAIDDQIDEVLANLKPVIDKWRLTPSANEQTRTYVPKKTKSTKEAIEKRYPYIDEDGNRYAIGKARAAQLGDPINVSSAAQLAIIFYDVLKCEAVSTKNPRATGEAELKALSKAIEQLHPETFVETIDIDEDDLREELENYDDSIKTFEDRETFSFSIDESNIQAAKKLCDLILKRRGVNKLITTYLDVIPTLATHWPDGRIRFHLNSLGTDTGRYSSGGDIKYIENEEPVKVSGINIQNIPSHEKFIRMMFRAAPGYKIIGADYSAQEPRLTAFLSKDKLMYQAYTEDKDLYAMIAQSAYDNDYADNLEFYPEGTTIDLDGRKVTCGHKTHQNKAGKERRSVGKVLLLAATYGMSAGTAGARLKKTREEGQQLLDSFFGRYVQVKEAIDYSKLYLQEHGYVEDWAGRRRHLPDVYLPAYDARSANITKEEEIGFNPFLSCVNKPFVDKAAETWKEIIKKYVEYSNEFQKERAAKEGKPWTANDEMGNRTFEKLSKVAANPLKEMNKPWNKDKPLNPYKNPSIKDKIKKATGIDIPETKVTLIANTGKRAQASRQCFNARIQGGAASLTKLAMINVFNDELLKQYDAHLIITVHDEVLVECKEEYAQLVEERLPKILVDTAKQYGIDVPMKCDPYNVTHWYEDEASSAIQAEFKKLEQGDEEKGILPISRDEALAAVISSHPELSASVIENAIKTGAALEF